MIQEVTFALSDEPGTLHSVLQTLAQQGVNLVATVALGGTIADFGVVVLICDPAEQALRVLNECRIRYQSRDVFAVAVENVPGQIAHIASLLGREGINIRHLYYTKFTSNSGSSLIVLSLDNNERGIALLEKSNVEIHRELPLPTG